MPSYSSIQRLKEKGMGRGNVMNMQLKKMQRLGKVWRIYNNARTKLGLDNLRTTPDYFAPRSNFQIRSEIFASRTFRVVARRLAAQGEPDSEQVEEANNHTTTPCNSSSIQLNNTTSCQRILRQPTSTQAPVWELRLRRRLTQVSKAIQTS